MTRILLIEDSRTQAERFRILLEDGGFEVDLATDGATGLLRFDQGDYDVVISDVVMPGLSGYDVCRRIKALPRGGRIPVMLLTMLDDPRDILRALQAGADNFVSKGDADETLVSRVQDLLRARAGREGCEAVTVRFMDEVYEIEPNTEQILDLLVATFGDNVRARAELEASNRKLEVQNEALRRVEALKQELSALVVHDLKSPASGLLMLAQMQLRKEGLAASDKTRWRMVFSTAETLQRMVLNLLDISRSEDGVLSPNREDVELDALVADVHGILQYQIDERRQTFEVRIDEDAGRLFVDRDLVRRVLLNLLDNACRHAPTRGHITVAARGTSGGMIRLCVANTGSTIPPEFRDRVFEKYVRLDRQASDSIEPGRGLGLPFCRTAIEAHRGRIWVEDHEGEGTAFCFELPRPTAESTAHAPQS